MTAHQPAYLPWLGFFHKIAISDVYVLLDQVQFEKKSFINRNKIKTVDGPQWLTIPVHKSGCFNTTISDIEIDNEEDWCRKHWNSLYRNYKKTPYFHHYADFFEGLYKQEWTYLIDILCYTMEYLFQEINLQTKVVRQSELHTIDKKQDLILEICKKLNADHFVFGKLGKNYASAETFAQNGIKIYFQDYIHPSYPQHWGEFTPYLSIVDLLFNVEKTKVYDVIMKGNIEKSSLL